MALASLNAEFHDQMIRQDHILFPQKLRSEICVGHGARAPRICSRNVNISRSGSILSLYSTQRPLPSINSLARATFPATLLPLPLSEITTSFALLPAVFPAALSTAGFAASFLALALSAVRMRGRFGRGHLRVAVHVGGAGAGSRRIAILLVRDGALAEADVPDAIVDLAAVHVRHGPLRRVLGFELDVAVALVLSLGGVLAMLGRLAGCAACV